MIESTTVVHYHCIILTGFVILGRVSFMSKFRSQDIVCIAIFLSSFSVCLASIVFFSAMRKHSTLSRPIKNGYEISRDFP